ncbi:MAG: hypothetical protein IJC18_03940 [Clostridia bacterium]|nr:hypothetical protein [Clostridia bacterium]MBQ9994564.1 hypothetical protein [Clostridia bacterium]
MSPKELSYIEDALGHEQFLISQCRTAVNELQDTHLRQEVQELMAKHQALYSKFFQLI